MFSYSNCRAKPVKRILTSLELLKNGFLLYLAGLQMELYAAAADNAWGDEVDVSDDEVVRCRFSDEADVGEDRLPISSPPIGCTPTPTSNGESREGVEFGETLTLTDEEPPAADDDEDDPLPTWRFWPTPEFPILVPPVTPPAFLSLGMPANLSLDGAGCCFACCRHFARRFLNQT